MIRATQELEKKFTKYEIARILGARALQVAMDAPLLVTMPKEELEKIRYDPIKIAEIELTSDVLPITVRRPLPRKFEERKKKSSGEEAMEGDSDEPVEVEAEKKEEKKAETEVRAEETEEEKVKDKMDDEIEELAMPEDEMEDLEESAEGGDEGAE